MLLKRFKRPSTYLGLLTVSWGIVMTCTGLVQSYAGLMAVRILLGIFEFVTHIIMPSWLSNIPQQSWILPWCHLAVRILVHAQGPRHTNLLLLLCKRPVGGLFWAAGCSHRSNGRPEWC
jgi:hypothetical protein